MGLPYGPDGQPLTASGEALTPAQRNVAAAAAPFRDIGAAAGSPTNPSYVTPLHPATGTQTEVLPNGQVSSPVVPGTLTDIDMGLVNGSTPVNVSELLGLKQGLAQPFFNLANRVKNSPFLQTVDNSISAAIPEYDAIVHSAERLAQPMMQDVSAQEVSGVQPGKIGRFVGNAVDSLVAPGGPMASGALSGALLSNSDDVSGMVRDALFGAAGGKIAHTVGGALAGVIAPKVAPNAKLLLNEGVPLTMGQIQGGALHRVEDAAGSIPILGDVIKNAQRRSLEGMNVAVANRALAPIGETLPAEIPAGRDAISYAGDKLSDRYEALIPYLNTTVDPQFVQDIGSLGDGARNLPLNGANTLGRIIKQNIIDKIDPTTGVLPGQAVKDAETALGQQIGRYSKSQAPDDQNLADGLKMTRQVIRDWVTRTNPQAADELSKLNTGWANLAIGEDAASRLAATDGIFTPSQLAGAVRAANDTVRKRGYARGEALMQDLSDAALDRLPQTVPDSGSPYRHALEAAVAAMVGKEAGMGPFIGRAGLAGTILSAPYTPAGQRTMAGILAGDRPNYAPVVANIIRMLQPLNQRLGAVTAFGALAPPVSPGTQPGQ